MRRRTGTVVLGAVGLLLVLLLPTTAAADLRDEQALADALRAGRPARRAAGGVRPRRALRSRSTSTCSSASRPSHCAARGTRPTSSRSRPTATDLAEPLRVPPRLPGRPARPGLRLRALGAAPDDRPPSPTVYAHVATDPGYPGELALQYWFFYPFNDFNNTHEGDWEMTQLVFDAADASEALAEDARRGRLQLARGRRACAPGATRSSRSSTARIRSSTRPPGSHANKFTAALYLGSSADAGVGCDNTSGPHRELLAGRAGRSRATLRRRPTAFPWITFEGRWGELQRAFFNGPTGPNMKTSGLQPIEWSQDWRDRGYAVPTGGVFGTGATDLFCSRRRTRLGSALELLLNPGATVLVLGLILALLVFAVVKATWTPVAPLRVGRRRSWGQILSVSGRMYVKRFRLFVGLGLLLIPITVVIAAVQWLLVSRDRRDLERHRQPRRLARVHRPRRRDDADVARPRARPGGDSVRARRDRRRTRRRAGRCLPARAAPDPAVARRDRDLRRGAGAS